MFVLLGPEAWDSQATVEVGVLTGRPLAGSRRPKGLRHQVEVGLFVTLNEPFTSVYGLGYYSNSC